MPKPRLPPLTLFTGGKECSLCEVAKVELAHVRRTHPFELKLWNIRDPPADVDEREAKKWRRLYQYDIPVLHLEDKRIQKHRIDRPALQAALEAWHAQAKDQESAEPGETSTSQSAESRDGSPTDLGDDCGENTGIGPKPVPWRQKVGKAWIELDSEVSAAVERQSETAPEVFVEIVRAMYANFAQPGEIPDGRDAILASSESQLRPYLTYAAEIDTEPDQDSTCHDIIYDRPVTNCPPGATKSATASRGPRADQRCWNCREPGHTAADCPAPRNHLMTRASRERFMFERDFVMPDYARSYLQDYVFDETERRRRLALIDRFRPGGKISSALADAVFWLEDDTDSDEDGVVFVSGGRGRAGAFHAAADMEEGEVDEDRQAKQDERDRLAVLKSRGQWPWLLGMLRWGYPPGWVAAKDPIEIVRRRVQHLPVSRPLEPDDDSDEDELEIFGDLDDASVLAEAAPPSPAPPRVSPPSLPPPPPPASDMPPEPPTPPPSSPPTQPSRPMYLPHAPDWRVQRPIKPLPVRPIPKSLVRSAEVNPYLVGRQIRERRWAHYPTDMYDSARLQVYSDARPLPLGF